MNFANKFAGRVALVTGAGSGIGRATAIRFCREGATVVCADINSEAAISTAKEAGENATSLKLDVTDEASWESGVRQLIAKHARWDFLVNSAGVSAGSLLPEMEFSEWRRVLGINLDGAFLGTKHAIRSMKSSGGSIVHVSSASGIKPAPGASAYSASKAGLCMLAKTAAKECKDNGWKIRVNTVCPAGVKTPLWSKMPFFQELSRQTGSEAAAFAAMAAGTRGEFAEPEDIVAVILFLCSEEARFITGIDLIADGGFVL